MIEITANLMTGVESVDNQHREIIARVNRLLNLCSRFDANTNKEAREILDFLTYYVGNHFADEERLQQECGYTDYDTHKREHTNFIENFMQLKGDFAKIGRIDDSILTSINITVVDWLVNHIGVSDVQFAKYYTFYQSIKPRSSKIVGRNPQ